MTSLVELSGKPLAKLIEVISKGLGTLYEPRKIRQNAKAEAEAIRIIAEAKAEALINTNPLILEQYIRLEKLRLTKEFTELNNIDEVVGKASQELLGKSVSDDKIDMDWANHFFESVKQISNERMQLIWAKILAGEIQRPGSFSRRTMSAVRNLSQEEAKIFQNLCSRSFSWVRTGECFYIRKSAKKKYGQTSFYIPDKDLETLESLGLIYNFSTEKHISRWTDIDSSKHLRSLILRCGNSVIQLFSEPIFNAHSIHEGHEVELPCFEFTSIGNELFQLIEIDFSNGFHKMKDLNIIAELIIKNALQYDKKVTAIYGSCEMTSGSKVFWVENETLTWSDFDNKE